MTWNINQFVFAKSYETGLVAQAITVKVRDLVFLVTRSMSVKTGCSVDGTNIWFFKDKTLKRIKLLKASTLLQDSRRPGAFYSIEQDGVIEYRISDFGNKIRKYRKWPISFDGNHICNKQQRSLPLFLILANLVFVPRGLSTGLALIDNNELVRLLQDAPEDWSSGTIKGNILRNSSNLPLNARNEMVILNVGIPGKTRRLFAIGTQEKSSIEKGLELIKVSAEIFGFLYLAIFLTGLRRFQFKEAVSKHTII